jgi:hypothetical protein
MNFGSGDWLIRTQSGSSGSQPQAKGLRARAVEERRGQASSRELYVIQMRNIAGWQFAVVDGNKDTVKRLQGEYIAIKKVTEKRDLSVKRERH